MGNSSRLSRIAAAAVIFLSLLPPFLTGWMSWVAIVIALLAWAAVVTVYFVYGQRRAFDPQLTDDQRFIEEAYKFIKDVFSASTGWLLGGLSGSLYAFLVLLYSASESALAHQEFAWYEKGPDAVAAFLAGLSTFLVITAFYRQLAPYTNMWELLDRLRSDLREAISSGKTVEVIWVYPGLGLGRYRSLDDKGWEVPQYSDEYNAFRGVLNSAMTEPKIKLKTILYPDDMMKAFYCSYYYQNLRGFTEKGALRKVDSGEISATNGKWDEVVEKGIVVACLKEESTLANTCAISGNDVYQVDSPDDMPINVIVIGDIVYHLASFGFPIFHPSRQPGGAALPNPYDKISGFFHPNPQDRLIRMVAFRTRDVLLSNIVKAHVAHFIKLGVDEGLLKKRA